MLVVLAIATGTIYGIASRMTVEPVTTPLPTATPVTIKVPAVAMAPTETPVISHVAAADPATSPTELPMPRYELSDAERDVVERVVMAEAGGEPYEGQMLVAQCILNAAEKTGTAPSKAVVTYSYCKARPNPTQSVKDAVAAVFDRGETVVDELILYFYNPARTSKRWHESQIFVVEVGGHRFFAEKG